jgi:hypothetical protein
MADMSIQTSANVAFGGSALVDLSVWIQQCLNAGDFVVPSTELITIGVACTVPLVHVIFRGIMRRVTRWADGDSPAHPQEDAIK